MKNITITVYLLLLSLLVFAQTNTSIYPKVGELCPDFELVNILGYEKDSVSLADLKGRYVVLDFWHRHCASCIASFPKMNALAKQFEGKIEMFMVGLEDEQGLAGLYDTLKERYELDHLPVAVDSALFRKFVPGGAAPHIVLIDKLGVVRAVTAIVYEDMLEAFIDDKEFEFYDLSYEAQFGGDKQYYDQFRPYLIDGNGGTLNSMDVQSRSMLLDFDPDKMPLKGKPASVASMIQHTEALSRNWFEAVLGLRAFYNLAYFGAVTWRKGSGEMMDYWREPILEMKDTRLFETKEGTWKNFFWYSLFLPAERWNEGAVMESMQSDLYRTFGFEVAIEQREMPYWAVTATTKVLDGLKSKGGKHGFRNDNSTIRTYTNLPFQQVIELVFRLSSSKTWPIIDETGFAENIDFEIDDGFGFDFDLVRKELEKQGIFLTEGRRVYNVLVIRDPS